MQEYDLDIENAGHALGLQKLLHKCFHITIKTQFCSKIRCQVLKEKHVLPDALSFIP